MIFLYRLSIILVMDADTAQGIRTTCNDITRILGSDDTPEEKHDKLEELADRLERLRDSIGT